MTMHDILILLAQADDAAAPDKPAASVLEMIQAGGVVGYIIIALSIAAMAMIVIHLIQLRRSALMPAVHVENLDALLSRGDVNGALEYCLNPENDSYLTRILAPGLTRFLKSAFGAFEVKTAIEEAGEEQTARLYRSTDVLSVIGSIGPLLGLLGTVLGIVGAFDTLSAGAAPDHKTLAGNISLALVTTLLGLIIAIPCMALFTYFRNRIDALASEAGAEIERLLLHLESAPSRPAAPAAGPSPAMRMEPARHPAGTPPPPTPIPAPGAAR